MAITPWTIKQEYLANQSIQAQWNRVLDQNGETIAKKIAHFIAKDAFEKLRRMFLIDRAPNLYRSLDLLYSLSLKENVEYKPWLLEVSNIAPFNEIMPLLLKKEIAGGLDYTNTRGCNPPLNRDGIEFKEWQESREEIGYLDLLSTKITLLVVSQLNYYLTTFTQNPDNESLQYKVTPCSRCAGGSAMEVNVILWIDKKKLWCFEEVQKDNIL